jgi:hypothetical protein
VAALLALPWLGAWLPLTGLTDFAIALFLLAAIAILLLLLAPLIILLLLLPSLAILPFLLATASLAGLLEQRPALMVAALNAAAEPVAVLRIALFILCHDGHPSFILPGGWAQKRRSVRARRSVARAAINRDQYNRVASPRSCRRARKAVRRVGKARSRALWSDAVGRGKRFPRVAPEFPVRCNLAAGRASCGPRNSRLVDIFFLSRRARRRGAREGSPSRRRRSIPDAG